MHLLGSVLKNSGFLNQEKTQMSPEVRMSDSHLILWLLHKKKKIPQKLLTMGGTN